MMSVSVRWEAFDTGTESVKEAFRRADEAMYHAKNACKEAHLKEKRQLLRYKAPVRAGILPGKARTARHDRPLPATVRGIGRFLF